jgi:hypothetical protein
MLGVSGDTRVIVRLTYSLSDTAFGRVLLTAVASSPSNTLESCIAACQSQNFTVAGTEYSGMISIIWDTLT